MESGNGRHHLKPASEIIGRLMDTVAYSGIETVYRGIEFRSRLEARWAAFFDACRWPWVYEPFDLPGWLPDFLIGDKVLVEVKPFTTFEQFLEARVKAELAMTQSGQLYELLLLGVAPLDNGEYLGWLGEFEFRNDDADPHSWWYERAWLGAIGEDYDFCHEYGSYRGRITCHYDGSQPSQVPNEMSVMWADACNATKWKPSRNGC